MKKVLAGKAVLYTDKLPPELIPNKGEFDKIWNLHPDEFSKIQMYDKLVPIPRWQQSYGVDYKFSNQTSFAEETPKLLKPYLDWAKKLNPAYNGLLLNWYDSDLKHYIGKHRDSTDNMVKDAPIIVVSLGATRPFRIREVGEKGFNDLLVSSGDVVVIPIKTNKSFTHEVPYSVKYSGKRVSISIRAFNND